MRYHVGDCFLFFCLHSNKLDPRSNDWRRYRDSGQEWASPRMLLDDIGSSNSLSIPSAGMLSARRSLSGAYHRRLTNRTCRAKIVSIALVKTHSRTYICTRKNRWTLSWFICALLVTSYFVYESRLRRKLLLMQLFLKQRKDQLMTTRGIVTDRRGFNLQHCLKFNSLNKSFHRNTTKSLCT